MYVVTVTFRILPGHEAVFRKAILQNAETSVLSEPGCHQFDVCVSPDDPGRVFLYELYDNRAAFEAHLATAHFKAFDAESKDWVADKQVAFFERVAW
jgi:quinol monooxygenase YgiN